VLENGTSLVQASGSDSRTVRAASDSESNTSQANKNSSSTVDVLLLAGSHIAVPGLQDDHSVPQENVLSGKKADVDDDDDGSVARAQQVQSYKDDEPHHRYKGKSGDVHIENGARGDLGGDKHVHDRVRTNDKHTHVVHREKMDDVKSETLAPSKQTQNQDQNQNQSQASQVQQMDAGLHADTQHSRDALQARSVSSMLPQSDMTQTQTQIQNKSDGSGGKLPLVEDVPRTYVQDKVSSNATVGYQRDWPASISDRQDAFVANPSSSFDSHLSPMHRTDPNSMHASRYEAYTASPSRRGDSNANDASRYYVNTPLTYSPQRVRFNDMPKSPSTAHSFASLFGHSHMHTKTAQDALATTIKMSPAPTTTSSHAHELPTSWPHPPAPISHATTSSQPQPHEHAISSSNHSNMSASFTAGMSTSHKSHHQHHASWEDIVTQYSAVPRQSRADQSQTPLKNAQGDPGQRNADTSTSSNHAHTGTQAGKTDEFVSPFSAMKRGAPLERTCSSENMTKQLERSSSGDKDSTARRTLGMHTATAAAPDRTSSPFSALKRTSVSSSPPSLSVSYAQSSSMSASWPASMAPESSHTTTATTGPTVTWAPELHTPTKIAEGKNAEGTVSPFTAMKRAPTTAAVAFSTALSADSSSPYTQAHATYSGPPPIRITRTDSPQKIGVPTATSLQSASDSLRNSHMSVPLNLELQVHANNEGDDQSGSESMVYASSSRAGSSSSQQARGLSASSSDVVMEGQQQQQQQPALASSSSYANAQPNSSKFTSASAADEHHLLSSSSGVSGAVDAQQSRGHGDGNQLVLSVDDGYADKMHEELLRSLVCMRSSCVCAVCVCVCVHSCVCVCVCVCTRIRSTRN
jgi:hypothetical protein